MVSRAHFPCEMPTRGFEPRLLSLTREHITSHVSGLLFTQRCYPLSYADSPEDIAKVWCTGTKFYFAPGALAASRSDFTLALSTPARSPVFEKWWCARQNLIATPSYCHTLFTLEGETFIFHLFNGFSDVFLVNNFNGGGSPA